MNQFSISEKQTPPENYPKIVYKYRSWDDAFHKRTLERNELYLSSPEQFNDPFDCRIPDNYYLLESDELKSRFIEKLHSENMEFMKANKIDLEVDFVRILSNLKSDIAKVQVEMNEILFRAQDLHYGILSMSTLWDSILMWGHYSNKHKGFCVGFYEEKLRESNMFGKGGFVQYKNKFPQINPLDSWFEKAFIQTHYKAKKWKYESEFRMSKTFFPNIPTSLERTVNLSDDSIAEVILGINIPEEDEREIIEIAMKKKIKVYKIYKVVNQFKLDRFLMKI